MAAVSEPKRSADPQEPVDWEEEEKRATHDHFKEIDEVRGLIDSLKNVWNDLRASEMSCERFTYIVDDYQEQPHLIDPYLEEIVLKLLAIGRDPATPVGLSRQAFTYLYLVTKMRGFKVVVRLFPHEVADMEPVLTMIEQQDPADKEAWQARYMLLLWLSMVCMIPFDLHRLDSNQPTGDGLRKRPVMERILSIAQMYLSANDKCQDAASYLLSHFLTRPDVKKEFLPQMVDWNLRVICTSDVDTMRGLNNIIGSLYTIALLFKHGKREDLLPYAPTVLSALTKCNFMERNNTLLRKTTTKVIQRLGLIFLKNRVAAWRYQRGSRSLAENLKTGKVSNVKATATSGPSEQQEEEEFEVPEETEEVIGQLLGCLKDKDTIVRWSAAKGVGRITGRLPKELADEVVGSVLELFSYQETDGAWHGGCLTLAELGRRGLLLPERLKDVVPIVLKALLYDERRGSYSVGSHVRDAACYVCWAFARAYEPKDIAPYVNKIANALVIVSIFDREVNVRRAAAAAFQENVGRQGTFPHGIDILTTVDYYTVGTCSHCYLDLSVFIAKFEEYTLFLIDHLVNIKVSHWDNTVRVLTAKALDKLTLAAPEHMASKALPTLLPMTAGIDLFQRHGAIIAIAEITHALFLHYQKQNKSLESVLGSEVISGLEGITGKLQTAKLFKGYGGEYMRKGVCLLIEKLSLSKLPFHGKAVVDLWQELLDECLSHLEPEIQAAAAAAIPAFFSEYYTQKDGSAQPEKQDVIIKRYLSQLSSSVEISRMGFSLGLGALPQFMLQGWFHNVLSGLIASLKFKDKAEEKMAEARRDAVKAISRICQTVGMQSDGDPQNVVCKKNITDIFGSLLASLKDYTMDSRGDVGSWVREAGMSALGELTEMVVKADPSLLDADTVRRVMCGLIQQACEKIDRTRFIAGELFIKLLYLKPELPAIPHRDKLMEAFPQEEGKTVYWDFSSQTFHRFARLLSVPTYTHAVLLGMTVSVGGLTESLVKHSSASLLNYLKGIKGDSSALATFTEALLSIFQQYQKNDRVSIPMLKMLDLLLGRQIFDGLPEPLLEQFPLRLLDLVKQEISRSGDPNKLMAAADVFCGMLQFPGSRSKSLLQLCVFLCHKYPRIRKTTANKVYEAVLTYDEVAPPESLDEILSILSETQWDEDVEQLRPIRNNLCDLFGISRPVMIKKKVPEESSSATST